MISFLVRMLAPLYGKLIYLFAYGPWGPSLHKLFIFIFRKLYAIQDEPSPEHLRLGDFFLRNKKFEVSHVDLVSPVQCRVMQGPEKIGSKAKVTVKAIQYAWDRFPELAGRDVSSFTFWNLYLAPYHYHWVHSPADASSFSAIRIPGAQYPVNSLGRRLRPHLYLDNERLSFRWTHPQLGKIYVLCVGAMGVSGLESCVGDVPVQRWKDFDQILSRGQRLAGFRLGSSVLLLVEKAPTDHVLPTEIFVGHPLLRP